MVVSALVRASVGSSQPAQPAVAHQRVGPRLLSAQHGYVDWQVPVALDVERLVEAPAGRSPATCRGRVRTC
jgi:hypothetical protein